MPEVPPFFLPAATPRDQESWYAELAKLCGRAVPDLEQRIYSITYIHDGDEWTATVGEQLRGVRRRTKRSRGKKIEQTQVLSDPATVLAIFPGTPYFVVTNHRLGADVGSAWENPFMAGQPKSITYFSRSSNPDSD